MFGGVSSVALRVVLIVALSAVFELVLRVFEYGFRLFEGCLEDALRFYRVLL